MSNKPERSLAPGDYGYLDEQAEQPKVGSEGKAQERFDAEGRQRPLADLWEEAVSEVERLRKAILDFERESSKPPLVGVPSREQPWTRARERLLEIARSLHPDKEQR